MSRFLFILLVISSTIFVNAKEYSKIEFNGLYHLSQLSAEEILGFKQNENVSIEDIDKAIKKFFELAYFKDIEVRDEDGTLIFNFVEKPLIANIVLEGINDSDEIDKYMPILGIKKGDIYDEIRVKEAKNKIIDLLRADGLYGTVVEFEIKSDNSQDGVELFFHINKGENITITSTSFLGSKYFDRDLLESTLANKQQDSFSWFIGRDDGKLQLHQLEFDRQRLKDFYLNHGFMDVYIDEQFLKVDFNNFGAKLFYNLEEGERYKVESIDLEVLDKKEESLDFLKDRFKLRSKRFFNVDNLRKDLKLIREEVGSRGYAFVNVFPDVIKDTKTNSAKIVYKVVFGEKVYINDVIISGNSRTLDRVIRREIFLSPGELYNLVELEESKKSLSRLGYFDDVTFEEKRVSQDKIDILVNVKETQTGSLMVGGGYSSTDGFLFNASISDRNIFGSGLSFSLSGESSDTSQKASFSVTNPRLNDSDYSLSTSFYKSTYEGLDYDVDTQGVGLSVGKKLTRYWSTTVGTMYNISNYNYDDLNGTDLDFYVEGEITKLSLTNSITFNNTDDYFIPRSGMIFNNYVEWAGFGEDQKFVKDTISLALFYGFLDEYEVDIVARYKTKYAVADADMQDTKSFPLTARLYLGGIKTLRGYKNNSVSPIHKDKNGDFILDNDGDVRRVGGNMMWANSFELNFPLIPSAKMRLSLFYDYGLIGTDALDISRSSYGTSIEWFSPLGPLQFVWAWPIASEYYDKTSQFEFTIGQTF